MQGRSSWKEAAAEVKARLDIVDIIGEYVVLKRQGRNYVGLCPFHQEKTPSFTVSPERAVFYCFGCGAGGDVYSFLMRQEQLSFGEALERLAARAGVSLAAPAVAQAGAAHRELYAANEAAQALYHRLLQHPRLGREARAYLEARGLAPVEWERFGLGWAPERDVVAPLLKQKGFSEELLVQAGLVIRREDGKCRDRFRRRVMFPIYDRRGRVVGFGGRALGEEQRPKYLNTPETPLFQKGKLLYGLNWAQAEARRRGEIVLVEGYMDVLSAHCHGLTHVVGTLGTALTPHQAELVRSCAARVVTSFDADTAGQSATWRGLDVLRDAGLRVWVAPLPQGYDPDRLVREQGAEALARLWREQAVPLLMYKLKQAREGHRLDYPEERAAVARELLPDIARLESPLERQEYMRYLAQELGLGEEALWAELKKLPKQDKKRRSRDNKTVGLLPARPQRRRAEEELLALMLEDRRYCAQIVGALGWDFFREERARKLATALRQWLEEHDEGSPDVVALIEQLGGDEEVAALAYELAVRDRAVFASVEDNIRNIRRSQLREEAHTLQQRLRSATGEESRRLLQRLVEVQRGLQQLVVPARERGEPNEGRSIE